MISVTMFPARNGDCFLVSYENEQGGQDHILIDCGYAETYKKYLREALMNIARKGEKISLFIITHVDQDHLLGAISFLKENNDKRFIEISEIWHNSYRHLQFSKEKKGEIENSEKCILQQGIALGISNIQDIEDELIDSHISLRQGSTLASLIYEGEYNFNTLFNNQAVSKETNQRIQLANLDILLLSPDKNKLDALSQEWMSYLKSERYNFSLSNEKIFDDAYEFFMLSQSDSETKDEQVSIQNAVNMEYISNNERVDIDTTILNGSSIALYLSFRDKKLLFLADAHPDILTSSLLELRTLGAIDADSKFDLVKIPHHGSSKNMTSALAKLTLSKKYLISTNGKVHNHPDLESLIRIMLNKTDICKEFIFNYPTPTSDYISDKSLMSKYNYLVWTGNEKSPLIITI
ncbi:MULTISPECIES: MBL fold metallo-hydrolase [Paenibacillus]|uniref:MBL fold metallo-hydrolase n=1 Tax=Paenibacillus TaxID=44249 RepID=UPI0015C62BBD|nr:MULTISPECIES: MBL fold metallo-hydrolase [Paenibacillus]